VGAIFFAPIAPMTLMRGIGSVQIEKKRLIDVIGTEKMG
jgi:hypothetical protein